MQRTISAMITLLQNVLDKEGDLKLEVEAEVFSVDGVARKIQAKAHDVLVQDRDGSRIAVISSNDGVEA